jgi:hypothetical protein
LARIIFSQHLELKVTHMDGSKGMDLEKRRREGKAGTLTLGKPGFQSWLCY